MYIDFEEIVTEYKKIINTNHKIHLNNNVLLEFTFKGEHLPHLLGLNRLKDIYILERYADENDRDINAKYIWKGICNKDINVEKFNESIYFEDIYEDKLKYFDLYKLIYPLKIIKFDSARVAKFVPKIDKVCYMFWEYFEESSKHGHFGIGFEYKNGKHYPNTLFFRSNDDYIKGQEKMFPYSYYIKHQDKSIDFVIYWGNVRKGLKKNSHYKYLKKHESLIGVEVSKMTKEVIHKIDNNEIKKHFKLLRLDEVKEVYLPYLESAEKWTNKVKSFLIEKIDEYDGDYKPNEIKSLLNEVPQE